MDAIYPSLSGRTCVVTGGATGIGAEISARLAAQNARVAILDIADQAGEALADDIAERGHPRPLILRCDLRNVSSIRMAFGEVFQNVGPPRVLINNAADDARHAFEAVTPEYWDDRFAVNLRHAFFAAQSVAPMMAEAGGGSIINLGSTSWILGQGGMPAYTTAKSAMVGLTRSLARDLGPKDIRVTCVVPGWTMTEKQLRLWVTSESEAEVMARQCIQRRLLPDDVARLVLFLASDEGKGCTGQSFVVDLGMT